MARRIGIDIGGLLPADRHVDGVVEMMIDATTTDWILWYRNCIERALNASKHAYRSARDGVAFGERE